MTEIDTLLVDSLPTPIGTLVVVVDTRGHVRAVNWADREARMLRELHAQYRGVGGRNFSSANRNFSSAAPFILTPARDPGGATTALGEYFAGAIGALDALAVETGGTPFQRQVWSALRDIPGGETISYTTLAARIARPSAVRAIGTANGANPISIVLPCHRVIGTSGALTGYGGGLDRKRWLLAHELAWRRGFSPATGVAARL